jgi:hypothetical protein
MDLRQRRSLLMLGIFFLSLALPVTGIASREGKRQPPHPVTASAKTEWLHAMEASIGTMREIDSSSVTSSSLFGEVNFLALTGWVIAIGCFVCFLSASAKTRRRERLLERGSKPDIFLYTPKK